MQKGNTVTLTLIALAVAVLAGVIVLYVVGQRAPEPVPLIVDNTEDLQDQTPEVADVRAGWNTYVDDEFDFSIQYPSGWVVEKGMIQLDAAITIRPDTGTTSARGPWSHHEAQSHVSVYPHGIASEGLFGEARPSATIVTVSRAVARDYIFENGRVWGTLVRFEQYPESWTEAGFMFARASIEEEEVFCLRGGSEIEAQSCDPLLGDSVVRNGFVDPELRKIQELIITSFAFVTDDGVTAIEDLSDEVTVTSPRPDEVVGSPLVVSGTAQDSWYDDGRFTVRLLDAEGTVLVEVPATAEDESFTETSLPFTVSLAFSSDTATSGVLILEKRGPNQTRSLEIPVRF